MQRKVHKHPQECADFERRQTKSWKDYHVFLDKRRFGNIYGGPMFEHKMLCINCRKAFKVVYVQETCMVCENKLIEIGQRVRVPRILASDRVWNEFIKTFVNK